MKTISLKEWKAFSQLEKIFYEKLSYEYVLGYMAMNNISNKNNEYFQEYQEVIRQYYLLCEQLKNEIIIPNVSGADVTWEVNFNEQYVEIREKAN